MIAAWVAAVVAALGMLGLLLRISFQVGSLVQRFGDHLTASDKIHADQETRLRALERRRRTESREPRTSGGHI